MKQRFTQTFLVTPTRQAVGLTSVALGIVRALQRLRVETGFAKPVAQDIKDNSGYFARQIFQIPVPDAMSLKESAERFATNQSGELLEDIVALCMKAGEDRDVLVVEGLHTDAAHSFTSQLNVDIARSLKAEVIIVADASIPNAVSDLRLSISQFTNAECKVAGVIFNKAPEDFDNEAARRLLGKIPLWGVVHDNPLLQAPRTLDVALHLNAEVVAQGELTTRRVNETLIAARSVAEFIPRLHPGALIITSGDRDDIILSVALAASRGIELAGLLLTHGTSIAPQVMELAAPALNTGLPILRTGDDSFITARRVSHISSAVPSDDMARMNAVLDTVAEHLDTEIIAAAFHIPESTKLSPPAFRYQLIQKARAAHKRIVLPEGEEPRTVRAAVICEEKGIARCVLLGKREVIETVAASQGITLPPGLEILDPDDIRGRYVAPMVELRKSKGLTPQQAVAQLEDTVVLGTMMLAVDEVDGLVSGAVHTTASTVRPALQLIKTAPGSSIVSSVFFMLMPDQVLVYGDCAINPVPSAEQLAEIAKQSADSATAFGITPKVAMISYSTGTSGSGVDVEKVRLATEIAHKNFPDLVLDGPLQYDAASVADVGRQKAPNSPVAGQATVFVFPDLNTGNTTYKAVQRSAHVVSVGPMLQGLRKPVNDLSRGALVDDIVFTIALTAIQAHEIPQGSTPAN
jgi:phosphate acetyltransferase